MSLSRGNQQTVLRGHVFPIRSADLTKIFFLEEFSIQQQQQWIRKHVTRCPSATGVVCCLPTCFTRVFQHGVVLPGLLSVVLLALLGWGFFGSNCVAGPGAAASGFLAGCGAGLVDAVLDSTLGVSNSVGFIWEFLLIGHSACVVR